MNVNTSQPTHFFTSFENLCFFFYNSTMGDGAYTQGPQKLYNIRITFLKNSIFKIIIIFFNILDK